MISQLEGSVATFLFLTTLSKVIRKSYLELMIWMISELEGSAAIFLFLTTLPKRIEKPCLELVILIASELDICVCKVSYLAGSTNPKAETVQAIS